MTMGKDEPDNRVLECAMAGHADAIVTGDRALLALHDTAVCVLSVCAITCTLMAKP
jgi:predicted nucleic acid-binding protein